MTIVERNAMVSRIAVSVVATAVLVLGFSCQAIMSFVWPATGAAAGAIAGSPGGPVGMVGGAALGGGLASGINQNAELRSGSLKGEDAWQKEVDYWKGEAETAQGFAKNIQKAKFGLRSILTWIMWILGVWLAIKYLWPGSRAARNFWGGILRILRGQIRTGIGGILSANGLSHTPTEMKPR